MWQGGGSNYVRHEWKVGAHFLGGRTEYLATIMYLYPLRAGRGHTLEKGQHVCVMTGTTRSWSMTGLMNSWNWILWIVGFYIFVCHYGHALTSHNKHDAGGQGHVGFCRVLHIPNAYALEGKNGHQEAKGTQDNAHNHEGPHCLKHGCKTNQQKQNELCKVADCKVKQDCLVSHRSLL